MNTPARFNTVAFINADQATDAVDQFLQESIGALEPASFESGASGRGRPRILPSLLLWSGMLVCILRGFSSQQALWRRITQFSLWYYPSDSAKDGITCMDRRAKPIGPVPCIKVVGPPEATVQLRVFSGVRDSWTLARYNIVRAGEYLRGKRT